MAPVQIDKASECDQVQRGDIFYKLRGPPGFLKNVKTKTKWKGGLNSSTQRGILSELAYKIFMFFLSREGSRKKDG